VPSACTLPDEDALPIIRRPVRVSGHSASALLIARPLSVQRLFGKRITMTSVSPRWAAARSLEERLLLMSAIFLGVRSTFSCNARMSSLRASSALSNAPRPLEAFAMAMSVM
jgi:hypothetical protein